MTLSPRDTSIKRHCAPDLPQVRYFDAALSPRAGRTGPRATHLRMHQVSALGKRGGEVQVGRPNSPLRGLSTAQQFRQLGLVRPIGML